MDGIKFLTKGFSFGDPFSSECMCEHPRVILHPLFKAYLARYGNYTFKGHEHRIVRRPDVYHFFCNKFYSAYRNRVTYDDVDSCYVTDYATGQVYPMYMVVPCGHCDLCADINISRFANKCVMESQMYGCDPIHLTMTYDNKHVPKDFNLRYDDVVEWKKRFRSRLEYSGYKYKLRMVCAGEYGTKGENHRPHYHVLIWNLCPQPDLSFVQIKRMAYASWRKCDKKRFHMALVNKNYRPKGSLKSLRQIADELGKSNSKNVFYYVAKYIYKSVCSSSPVFGRVPPFLHASKSKFGGIGAPFLDSHMFEIRHSSWHGFKFRDKFSGEVHKLVYDRYVLNRCFPNLSQSVPYRLRKYILDFTRIYPWVQYWSGARALMRKISRRFSKVMYLPFLSRDMLPYYEKDAMECPAFKALIFARYRDDREKICKYDVVDIARCLQLNLLRQDFLYHTYNNRVPPDKIFRLWKIREKKDRQIVIL